MSKETEDKDVVILAFPSENIATAEGNSADGMIFMNKKYGSTAVHTIPGNEINSYLKELKESNLSFSFKAGTRELVPA